MLETKAASVAKRMSTAMFVRIISVVSMRVSCRNPSIMLRNTFYPVRYLSWEHVRAGILYSLYV